MAQLNYEPTTVPVCVVGSQFMLPNPLELIVDTNSRGNIVITDINHQIILKVKPFNTIFHQQRLLVHADDKPIVMIRAKLITWHKRWKVYKGDNVTKSDKIFSTNAAHAIQSKTNVHVSLANKTKKKEGSHFMIKGSWSKRNCTVYMRDSSMIIARMHAIQASENSRFVKDRFMLEVFPNVDYAFVVALIAIVDATKGTTMKDRVIDVVTDVVIEAAFGGAGP